MKPTLEEGKQTVFLYLLLEIFTFQSAGCIQLPEGLTILGPCCPSSEHLPIPETSPEIGGYLELLALHTIQ